MFGAELLWSVLPFLILLSSLANRRIDDDLSTHLGLNRQGAHVVRSLFRNSPTHSAIPILIGLIIATAVLWQALAAFSSITFSSTIIEDSKLYGTIGVVFTLLTWFILIGVVVMLGAACGAVWEDRTRSRRSPPRDSLSRR